MSPTVALLAVHAEALGILQAVPPAILYAGSFLVALAILIFVHEFGHFAVARALGVGVTKFSFGFGPKIVGVTRGETEYLVSAIPFGGYVRLVGESESEELPPDLRARSFSHKPAWVKMAVVLAGPAGNLLFAFLVFWGVYVVGFPVATARIDVAPGSPAERAGLKSGDLVVAVGGTSVGNWDDLDRRLRRARTGEPLEVEARRDGAAVRAVAVPEPVERRNEFGEAVMETGIGVEPVMPASIGDVVPGLPAARAGLAKGDTVLSVGGEPVATWEQMAQRIRASEAGKPLEIVVRRGGATVTLAVRPELQEVATPSGEKRKEPKIGIVPGPETTVQRLDPARALVRGAERTWSLMALTAKVVVKLVTRVVPARTLGGPILIAQIAGDQARQGVLDFVIFLGFLSVNLGILNLLPIPILDGGHILFYSIEGLRRKPLSPQAREIAQQIGLAIILMLVVLVFYNDIARLVAR